MNLLLSSGMFSVVCPSPSNHMMTNLCAYDWGICQQMLTTSGVPPLGYCVPMVLRIDSNNWRPRRFWYDSSCVLTFAWFWYLCINPPVEMMPAPSLLWVGVHSLWPCLQWGSMCVAFFPLFCALVHIFSVLVSVLCVCVYDCGCLCPWLCLLLIVFIIDSRTRCPTREQVDQHRGSRIGQLVTTNCLLLKPWTRVRQLSSRRRVVLLKPLSKGHTCRQNWDGVSTLIWCHG